MTKSTFLFILSFIISNCCYGQDPFLDLVYKIKPNTTGCEYTRAGLDSIVKFGNDTVFVDKESICGYENQQYIQGRYLRILNYLITGQATYSIYEFKSIIFNHEEYLLFSNISGVKGYTAYDQDSLTIFRVENHNLFRDDTISATIERFRSYEFFTDDKEIIKSSNKNSFIYELGEDENEISIAINECDDCYRKIERRINGEKLIIQFKDKIEKELTEKPKFMNE
mgnify:CR=1 FL=1